MFKYNSIRKPDFKNISDVLEYDNYWEYRGWEVNNYLKSREVVALNLIPSGSKVLDMGCGNSLLPIKLKEKGCNVFVADVSDKVLGGYSKYGINGDRFDLEKDDPSSLADDYDYIILFEVLEHMRYPEQVIKKLSENTRRFLITVPNSAAFYYRFSLLIKGRFFTQWVHHPSEHLRYWSHIDFLEWLDAMGLHVEKAIGVDGLQVKHMFPKLPNLWKNFLADRVLYCCSTNKTD